MSAQPSVLQVVVMRDGLLVGTEVFVPGQYSVGASDASDLRLDDPTVTQTQAWLHFRDGRAAIQESGDGMVFVNGHRVQACEVRSMDEVSIGPFSLKVRVVTQKAQPSAPPPPAPARAVPPQPQGPVGAQPTVPARPSNPRNAAPPAAAPQQPAATVVSPRRGQTAPPGRPAANVGDDDPRTESVHMAPPSPVSEPSFPTDPLAPVPDDEGMTRPGMPPHVPGRPPPAAPVAPARSAPAAARPAAPTAKPAAHGHGRGHGHGAAASKPKGRGRILAKPSIPPADEGKGTPHLFVECWWGDTRRFAGSWTALDPKKGLVGGDDDFGSVPLWGFGLEGGFRFAEGKGGKYRVFIPPKASVERRASDGQFYATDGAQLEKGPAGQPCVSLANGHAVRFSGGDAMTVVAYVQPAIPRGPTSLLKTMPWLVLVMLVLVSSLFGAFVYTYVSYPDKADFQAKNLNPVAVRLIAPPKKEEKKKIEEKLQKLTKVEKKIEKPSKIEKELPKAVAPETKKALKSIEKLTAAGPALKDLLAAVDKLGSGPGKKDAKNDFKLTGIIGKAPIASAGLGSFGLGGGGSGGNGIKGLEMLRGKGGGGIGALGTGSVGKGSVAGTVTHASARAVSAQGTIDKDAVAKAINSHLGEVSSCYERALLKEPGLAGKIVLEWQISTSGTVTTARTKSSTMKSTAVEQCILASLKGWKFPPAQGAGVMITYPFMFNSVGY